MAKLARIAGLALCATFACLLLAATGVSADGGRVSAAYQGYSAAGGQDPYAASDPQDVHVGGYGGQPVVDGYVRLNVDSLPSGSTIEGLTLRMVPNASPSDNVNSAAAAIEACGLTQPLTSNGYQSSPPPYDCAVHAAGEPQSDGSWLFEVAALARQWTQGANDGLALVAYGQTGTPAGSVSPSAWSVAFDSTKTMGTVDYVPGAANASIAAPPVPAAGASSTQVGLAPLPAPPPAAAAAPPQAPPAASAARPGTGQSSGTQVVTQAHLQKQWVWLTLALGGAALLMLLVGAGQHVMRSGKLDLGLALAASRSQLATPIAVLALAAVFALGSTTQLVTITGSGSSGSGGAAGSLAPGAGPAGGPAAATGAAGGGSATAGAAATSGGAAAAATNGGQDGPGVTSSTVRIGFIYVVNGQAANQAFGIKAPSAGNEQSQQQAMVDYINKHGGLAGRQIQPVFIQYDNSKAETDPTINEENCHTLTEDYHVFAVIGGGGPPDAAAAQACYAQAGTMDFEGEITGGTDLQLLRQASPYLWLGSDPALDRTMTWEVAGLRSRGFFSGGPTYKLGVVISDDPVNRRIYQQVTLPALQAAGVQSPDTFPVPHDTISDIANTMKQAVIHFQADGVTNVIFQGGGNYGTGSYAVLFMLDAESQHYTPTYGFNSEDGFGGLTATVPQDQFNHALAVGWVPGVDTDDAHGPPFPSGPGEKLCESIMAASGNGASTRSNAEASLVTCAVMLQIQQAGTPLKGQPLNAQLLADQLMKLGPSTFNAILVQAGYGPGHWDAPTGYRWLHAELNCNGNQACFLYDNSNVYG